MKRLNILVIILLMLVTVSACTKKEKDTVTILTPMGSPALSQMYVEEKKDEYNYKIDAVQGADALSSAFLTKSYDIIFAPLNLGAKMYINNQNYKLLAIVTDCNYYFVVKSETDLTLDTVKSMNITLFGEAAMSGIISRYVLSNGNKDDISSLNIIYVNSVADSMSEFIKDNSICALLSEPQLSTLSTKVSGLKVLSVKDEYTKLSKLDNVPQAGCFVRSDLEKDVVSRYKNQLKDSISKVNKNVDDSAVLGNKLYSSFSVEVLKNAIPRSEIVFKDGKTAKTNAENFFKLLNDYNPKLLGGEVDEGFYFN